MKYAFTTGILANALQDRDYKRVFALLALIINETATMDCNSSKIVDFAFRLKLISQAFQWYI